MERQGEEGRDLSLTGLLNCPKCTHSNPLGTRYCQNCGASLAGVSPTMAEAKQKRGLRGLLGRKDRAA
jgi:predicted amidophosphoribosyltransferase